ncbi:MAG: hypothetical protein M0R46_16520 [Candidatus Muirbacterium halophilum]|nr:hypothetical protein [Candidatus Muirbacterium halophilum]
MKYDEITQKKFIENIIYQTDLYSDVIFDLKDSKNIQLVIVDIIFNFFVNVSQKEWKYLQKN